MKLTGKRGKSIGSPLFLILLSCILFSLNASGQKINEGTSQQEANKKLARVTVDGRVLFYVGGTVSFPAGERASVISRRIISAASDRSIPVDSVKIHSEGDQLMIYAGKAFIMLISGEDAKLDGRNQAILAWWTNEKIKETIAQYRQDRSRPVLIKNFLYALGASLVYILSLVVILWLVRCLKKRLESRIRTKIEAMESKSFRLVRSVQVLNIFRIFIKTIILAVIILITAVFIQYVLGLFPWTKGVAAYTLSLILQPLVSLGNSFLGFLPSLGFLIVIYFVTRYLLKLMKLFFTGIQEGGIKLQKFDDDWAMPTYKILRVIVIIFALVIAYPYIPGSETSAFKGISVFLGVLLSLGSSSFISNIIAGYSMTYRGAFKKGDLIMMDDQVGFVEDQRLLVTRLRSRKNEDISIPNSVLLNSNIINFSKRAKDVGLILHTSVGIGYETPWRLVDAMLKEAAARTEGLLKEPPPFVLKHSLGDFAVSYEINAYCNDASRMMYYYNVLHENILDVFNENNVQIMTPAYEGDPEIPKVVPKDQWNQPLSKSGDKK
jgi:small-conductance mechanosensitive channel